MLTTYEEIKRNKTLETVRVLLLSLSVIILGGISLHYISLLPYNG